MYSIFPRSMFWALLLVAGGDCAGHDGDGGYYRPEAHRIELHYDAAQSCGGGGVS